VSAWRRICCPVDFSECSRVALGEAVRLARDLHAELLLVHVLHRGSVAAGQSPFAPPEHRAHQDATGEAGRELAAWTQEAQRAVPTTSVELSGDPAPEVVRFASEFGCDLIVVGTHGRTGLARAALGSVAEAVVRSAPCPVLVVRRPAAGAPG
jgi:universal stress protein A